jgi:hypothetical protein
MHLSWLWRRRPPKPPDDEQARAEALVKVEALGLMGGRAPELRLTPVIRVPRRPSKPLAIEHDE